MKTVLLEQSNDGITWIRLNREERRNAINIEMMEELDAALSAAEEDESRIVVITGVGQKAFCGGGDLSVFHKLKTEAEAKEMLLKMGTILERLFFFPKVTVAALNGTAVGGGCEIASACDLRIAAPHAKIGFVQGAQGITTGWGGGTLLTERLTQLAAMEMLMTARVYHSEEARELGFLQDVIVEDSFQEGVKNWMAPYLKQNKGVLSAYKARLIDRFDRQMIHNRMNNEINECARLWETDDHHEAVQRFLEKR
ncbi:enoyl-CoA hydratase/isomerase family protein [Halalkalibacter nanhaiisediminis]|uniref:Ethylmalonyl-CoA decarboxylase n=1 Tax=Halalkalibacter nanhaiisediminis TaxID=688079 RepID=A0A562QHX6_9BACI|nr:enoyl-CoA hydratase/isomerase family protein [Halalkalibacter nanhaiisediminis]TWI55790.1 enoyl-CoA hydratase/carnithine racemase [Halalkalibacter nanhaiisediminis]